MRKKISILGSKSTTYELLKDLVELKINIHSVISLDSKKAKINCVANYEGNKIKKICLLNHIKHNFVSNYKLEEKNIIKIFKKTDVLFVIGWERIIPKDILNVITYGCYGMHGSYKGLPFGRGRSPLNWSLIQGNRFFYTSLFKYNSGIDDGDIVDTKKFEINSHDDIFSLHAKNQMIMSFLIKKNIKKILSNSQNFISQKNIKPTYYPKRLPDDGVIDWNLNTKKIYNIIRALKPPYPSAFTFLNKKKIFIYSARPFDKFLNFNKFKNGSIIKVFLNKFILVKTSDGSILIEKYYSQIKLKQNQIFRSIKYKTTLQKVRKRYPKNIKKINKEI